MVKFGGAAVAGVGSSMIGYMTKLTIMDLDKALLPVVTPAGDPGLRLVINSPLRAPGNGLFGNSPQGGPSTSASMHLFDDLTGWLGFIPSELNSLFGYIPFEAFSFSEAFLAISGLVVASLFGAASVSSVGGLPVKAGMPTSADVLPMTKVINPALIEFHNNMHWALFMIVGAWLFSSLLILAVFYSHKYADQIESRLSKYPRVHTLLATLYSPKVTKFALYYFSIVIVPELAAVLYFINVLIKHPIG